MLIFEIDDRHLESMAMTDGVRSRTWSELQDNVLALAEFFKTRHKLKPGDHIALHMGNRVEFIESLLAGILAGLWVTPINTHLTEPEARYILENCDARLLLVDSEHQVLVNGANDIPVLDITGWFSGDTARPSRLSTAGIDSVCDKPSGGTMLYTSGTTGRPKGVMRAKPPSVGEALDKMKLTGKALGLDGEGAHLVTGPLYHAAPMLFAVYDLLNGAPVVIMPRWDERKFLQQVIKYRVTKTHLVPTMMVRLLKLRDQRPDEFDFSCLPATLSLVLHGAAPIAEHTKSAMLAWWGDILVEYWGGSEAGVTTLVNSQDWRRKSGTVGKPLPHFTVYVGDNDGNPSGDSEGELYCRHRDLAQVFSYYKDEKKTAKAHPQPYVFSIGDRGYVDAEGYVFLKGRESNMIISGGVNIYPAEIEHVLISHPDVEDCAVLGVPDDEWGEQVRAVVQLRKPVGGTLNQSASQFEGILQEFLGERIARYKMPRAFTFVDHIPRMPTGKIMLSELEPLVS